MKGYVFVSAYGYNRPTFPHVMASGFGYTEEEYKKAVEAREEKIKRYNEKCKAEGRPWAMYKE